jgi:hypothetical protein
MLTNEWKHTNLRSQKRLISQEFFIDHVTIRIQPTSGFARFRTYLGMISSTRLPSPASLSAKHCQTRGCSIKSKSSPSRLHPTTTQLFYQLILSNMLFNSRTQFRFKSMHITLTTRKWYST